MDLQRSVICANYSSWIMGQTAGSVLVAMHHRAQHRYWMLVLILIPTRRLDGILIKEPTKTREKSSGTT